MRQTFNHCLFIVRIFLRTHRHHRRCHWFAQLPLPSATIECDDSHENDEILCRKKISFKRIIFVCSMGTVQLSCKKYPALSQQRSCSFPTTDSEARITAHRTMSPCCAVYSTTETYKFSYLSRVKLIPTIFHAFEHMSDWYCFSHLTETIQNNLLCVLSFGSNRLKQHE